MAARGLDYEAPVAAGILRQVTGRAPANGREVALTTAAAERIGAGLGDTVHLVRPEPGTYRVVGLVEDPDSLSARVVVFRPDAIPAPGDGDVLWLADTPHPMSWSDVQELNRHGMVAVSRSVMRDPPPDEAADAPNQSDEIQFGVLIAGMAMLEIVLLAGPAFAIGARRRQRELGLVAAAGGKPAHVRWIVLADGVVLGGIGAVLGIAIGVATAYAGMPVLEEYLMRVRAGGFRVFPLALVAISGLAVLTGLLAALVPAIVASRQDVVVALSGRRGVTRSKRRWIAVGLVTTSVGGTVAFLGARSQAVLGGLVLMQLGLAICMPSLIGAVARIGGVLPLAPRIAIRTTGRNRSAAAPAVAAVMAAVAGAVTVAMMVNAQEQRQVAKYHAGIPAGHVAVTLDTMEPGTAGRLPAVTAALRRTLPVTDVRTARAAECGDAEDSCWIEVLPRPALRCPIGDGAEATEAEMRRYDKDPRCQGSEESSGFALSTPVVDDGSILPVATGADADDVAAARRTLAAGGVVVGSDKYLLDGRTTLSVNRPEKGGEQAKSRHVEVPAYALHSGIRTDSLVVIGKPLADRLELRATPMAVLASTSRTPTEEQQEAADEAVLKAGVHGGADEVSPVYVERGAPVEIDPYLLLLGGIAGLVMLGASAIATGLVLSDSRSELSTLAAVGAAPGLRRRLTLAQSGLISGLGGAVGGLVGVGAAAAILFALNRQQMAERPGAVPYPYAVPWSVLAITMVVVPLVAMLGAGLLTRSRLPIERRLT
jgi:putative ABC transport system permease protein